MEMMLTKSRLQVNSVSLIGMEDEHVTFSKEIKSVADTYVIE